ncbi:MAG: histidine phosphatase family protein [Proteobacteria bacterium]|nr:histidine phosphatase family protein [Pseudomonadota bacterium]
MHELILMRHAEALPAAIDAEDFARPLSEAGRGAAARAATTLSAGVAIERLLYSPARRTTETALIVADVLSLGPMKLLAVPELYLATPQRVREALARWHGKARTILVIGHNPSLSELGAQLAPAHKRGHLQTAGYWRLPFDAAAWRALTHLPPHA